MSFDFDDTICAIASAPGGALRGIVRVSGPACIAAVDAVFRAEGGRDLALVTRPTCLDGFLCLPEPLGQVASRVYLWPTDRSYTRQPLAELHTIGSPPLLEATLEAVRRAGARLARPGEFTLRAFLAGRLDLTQAEAVLGVIDARGPAQLHTALSQLAGGLATPLAALRERLLDLLAHLEAGLDFAEEDIAFISAGQLDEQLAAAAGEVASLAARMTARGEAGQLPRVVLLGEPNAGKSSLFNALTGRPAAIVSDQAGTTRDFVAKELVLGGGQCLLIDTAGVMTDAPGASLAAAAQGSTGDQAQQADVIVICVDASRPATPWEKARIAGGSPSPQVIVWTKIDVANGLPPPPASAIATSSRSGAGLDELRQAIAAAAGAARGEAGIVATTASRCRESLELSAAALGRARELAAASGGEELIAAEVRAALDGLGQVVGAVYTEDVLDRVFSRFCIGK
jgi:tRNA modification GTPase